MIIRYLDPWGNHLVLADSSVARQTRKPSDP